jgi:hypothetical protein
MKEPKPSKTKGKPAESAPTAAAPTAPAAPVAAAPPSREPPLFRRIDWLALLFAFAVVWTIYFLTLAPCQTLEDSGELCTGAFYAGIPHPPGYPFWTIYAWLWTKLLPVGNVAWRVEVGQATAAAMACGLVAFMVSRGSSMLVEGIDELKSLTGKWENAICLVSGTVAGVLLGLGGVTWSESVAINRISLFGVPWVMIVMLCLLRWIYAPSRRRYLFCAMFFFGICATIHQTLLVAAMGIEIAVASVQPKLGRDLFLANSIIYVAGIIANSAGFITMLNTAPMVLGLYHLVGIGSFAAWIWLAGKTKSLGTEWKAVIFMGLLWAAGASFYFYEAIAGMTNPPMQWGYPRTVQGFYHALSRGQYEKANPSNPFQDPGHFLLQVGLLISDIVHEYNWVCLFIALVPLLFFFKMQHRERSWLIALVAVYFCIGGLLLILMNPQPDRQSADLNRVFFTPSHALIAIMIGYGFSLTAAYIATHYRRFRGAGLMLGVVAIVPALTSFYNGINDSFHGGLAFIPYDFVLLLFVLLAVTLVLASLAARRLFRLHDPAEAPNRADHMRWLLGFAGGTVVLLAIAVMIVFSRRESLSFAQMHDGLSRLFAPQQYKLPAIAGLLILGVVVAFIGGLLVYRERAPLSVTLGLFALMPVASGLSHWAGSEQRNHWFGYWFGHDMFTPPVVGADGKMTYDARVREQMLNTTNKNLVYPEMTPNTVLYGGTDPGRFNPTYMIFCDSFIPDSCKPVVDRVFDRRDVYLITQNALADDTYLDYLRAQYYRSNQKDPPFFSELARNILKDSPYKTNLLAQMVSPLDWFFEARGARVEKRWRTSTSWFSDKDFVNLSALATKLQPSPTQDPVSKWLFDNFSKDTQALLTGARDDSRLRAALITDLNILLERELKQRDQLEKKLVEKDAADQQAAGGDDSERLRRKQDALAKEIAAIRIEPLYESNRFAQVTISDYLRKFIAQNPESDTRIRLNRLLLEAAYPADVAKSIGGVYPDREIYIASPEDLQRCFSEYTQDAARRYQHDTQFPNEPRQVRGGEGVTVTPDGRVAVSGQTAVMSINGLLTKVIFDHNPDNEFYVEESFPLDWMFPYLTPYGIIMKINRQQVPEITAEMCQRDHEFWSHYSERLTGNWITYDTTVKEITEFVERVYLGRNLKGFTGNPAFVRDDQAQKAFSKLRSSIGGIYSWRLGLSPGGGPVPPQFLPKTPADATRMVREAEFAFKQAFAFCPYSPEAVFRFVSLLMTARRTNDALLVAETCLKLDPYSGQAQALVANIRQALGK